MHGTDQCMGDLVVVLSGNYLDTTIPEIAGAMHRLKPNPMIGCTCERASTNSQHLTGLAVVVVYQWDSTSASVFKIK